MGALWDQWYTPADATTIKYKVRTIIGPRGYHTDHAEDLEQRLAISVWKAMHEYDPTKGTRSTYLKTVLNNAAAKIIEHDTAQKRDLRKERPLDVAGADPAVNGKSLQVAVDRQLDLAAWIARLPENLQVTARLLMVMSPAEVARQAHMTRGKARQQTAQIRHCFHEFSKESK
jgi:RNA polymerase sigma factor (sigma-70 family)